MKNIKKFIVLLILTVTASSCYYDKEQDAPVIPTDTIVSFATDIQTILNNNCIMCHTTDSGLPDWTEGNSYATAATLIASGSIVPGNSAGSELMEMLNFDPVNPNPMPPSGKMAVANITLFATWIDQGAKNN